MNDIDFNELAAMWHKLSPSLQIPLAVVLGLLCVCAVVSIIVSVWLGLSYHKYNRKQNSVNLTGEAVAKRVLKAHDLSDIQVKCSGSFLFGNSYSHYFKKVRLRRMTWKKTSVSSLAMALQKSCLAILDKENDPDMRKRVRLTPLIYVGPIACIPLILIGAVIDIILYESIGTITVACTVLGFAFYLLSFVMSLMVLRTEVKAQQRAFQVARDQGLANEEEIGDMQKLFRLYNIEYVNNMVTALLELILRVLMLLAKEQASGSVD